MLVEQTVCCHALDRVSGFCPPHVPAACHYLIRTHLRGYRHCPVSAMRIRVESVLAKAQRALQPSPVFSVNGSRKYCW